MIGKFKVKLGISNLFDIDPSVAFSRLKKLGCDEIYTGYTPGYIEKQYPSVLNIMNRRGKFSGASSFAELARLAKAAKKHHLDLSVALNNHYVPTQYPALKKMFHEVDSIEGVSSVIVSDLGLIRMMRATGFSKEVHLSLRFPIFNSSAVDFITEHFGIRTIALPRSLTADEICDLSLKHRKIAFELLVCDREDCLYVDGYCTSMHLLVDSKVGYAACKVYGIPRGPLVSPCKRCFLKKLEGKIDKLKFQFRHMGLKKMIEEFEKESAFLRALPATREKEWESLCSCSCACKENKVCNSLYKKDFRCM
jgi:hypothetical protein